MKNEFIPYTQGMELKWLGFNEQCLAVYFNGTFFGSPSIFNKNESRKGYLYDCTAPLYQQAFRWFREKHKLESSIQRMPPEVYGKGRGDIKNYLLYIWAENLNPRGQQTLHFDTYEEAEFECLKKLIEIVKNK